MCMGTIYWTTLHHYGEKLALQAEKIVRNALFGVLSTVVLINARDVEFLQLYAFPPLYNRCSSKIIV